MAKGQRKQKQDTIRKEVFESLCGIQCTRAEILAVLNVSKDTLLRWCKATYGTDFETIWSEKREGGKASLRRAQWQKAIDGDSTMLIWLGKQLLDQADKKTVTINTYDDSVREMNDYFSSKQEQKPEEAGA